MSDTVGFAEMYAIVQRIGKLRSVLAAEGFDVEVKAEVTVSFNVVVNEPKRKKAKP